MGLQVIILLIQRKDAQGYGRRASDYGILNYSILYVRNFGDYELCSTSRDTRVMIRKGISQTPVQKQDEPGKEVS